MKIQFEKKPLNFPTSKKVSAQTTDFIRKMLQEEETNRISWEEIFANPEYQIT